MRVCTNFMQDTSSVNMYIHSELTSPAKALKEEPIDQTQPFLLACSLQPNTRHLPLTILTLTGSDPLDRGWEKNLVRTCTYVLVLTKLEEEKS